MSRRKRGPGYRPRSQQVAVIHELPGPRESQLSRMATLVREDGLACWTLLAFFGIPVQVLLIVSGAPAWLLRTLGMRVESLPGRLVIASFGLAVVVALIYGAWRAYTRNREHAGVPESLSSWIAAAAVAVLACGVLTAQSLEPPRQLTRVDLPWLVRPIEIEYPYAAEIAGRQGTVDVKLVINDGGEIESYELSGSEDADLRGAVAEAVEQMQVNTENLGADSYPFTKQLRIPFVVQ